MNCLLIDTALQGTLVAIYAPERGVLAVRESAEPYGQSEILIPMIADVLAQAGAEYKDLTRIAVVKGPGAFTGLRVGLAAAQSLRQVLEIPATGICSFEALFKTYTMTHSLAADCTYVVLIETKRQDYYVQAYEGGLTVGGAAVLSAVEIQARFGGQGRDVVVIGDAVARFAGEVSSGFTFVEILRPSVEALMALVREGDDDLSPAYLRPADVSFPKDTSAKKIV